MRIELITLFFKSVIIKKIKINMSKKYVIFHKCFIQTDKNFTIPINRNQNFIFNMLIIRKTIIILKEKSILP